MNKEFTYKKEIRRGFAVSEVMKRSWAANIKVLEEIQDICRKLDVNIFACYGTLLGAIREHGFIPWDDDLDMGLVGDDYIKFIDAIANDHSDRYQIFNPYTRTWYKMNFSHIVNQKDVSFARENLKEWCGCPFMTGLDIYPYYYIPRNKDDEEFILTVLGKIDNTIALSRKLEASKEENDKQDIKEALEKAVAINLVELQHLTGCSFSSDRPLDNQLEILYDQVCRIPDEAGSDYVTRYDEYVKDKNKKYPKEYLRNIVYIPFENTSMPCPVGYNDILVKRFGREYIVPRQEKGAHDYPYYRKQLDDKEYYEEEVKRGLKADALYDNSAKDISDPIFKKKIRRRLYHTSIYEMLINCNSAITTIKDTLSELMNSNDGAELWCMPDMFFKTDEWAMDMVAPDLIRDYEEVWRQYAEIGIKFINVTDKYDELTSCFDEYYGDAGLLADKFQKANKKTVLHKYGDNSVDIEDDPDRIKDRAINVPDTWKRIIMREDGSMKKVIIYVTGRSMLFQYRERIVEKIKSVLDVLGSRREDIALIWCPYIMNKTEAAIFGESFVAKMNKLMDDYRAEAWGILDTSGDPEKAVDIADAAYGDSEYIIARCMEKGIPTMIQNPDIV